MIVHRGPDQGAVFHDGGAGLVARRLKIIDSRRPAPSRSPTRTARSGSSTTARSTTTAAPAGARGARPRFRGRCDTEVIVHAWEEWGDALRRALPRHVRLRRSGTPRAGSSSSARDRLGIKPLYYARGRTGSPSARRSRRSSAPGQSRGRWTSSRSTTTSATSSSRRRRRCSVAIRKLPAGSSCSSATGADSRSSTYWDVAFGRGPSEDQRTLERRIRDGCSARPSQAADVGRAARRLPVRRARLDGGARVRPRGDHRTAPDVHHRLSRSIVQRMGLRAARRPGTTGPSITRS